MVSACVALRHASQPRTSLPIRRHWSAPVARLFVLDQANEARLLVRRPISAAGRTLFSVHVEDGGPTPISAHQAVRLAVCEDYLEVWTRAHQFASLPSVPLSLLPPTPPLFRELLSAAGQRRVLVVRVRVARVRQRSMTRLLCVVRCRLRARPLVLSSCWTCRT